jgi:protein-disulfide isomerase
MNPSPLQRALRPCLVPALLVFATAGSGCAQSPSSSEVEALRQELRETQKELAELKEMLAPILRQLPQPFRPHDASVSGSPMLGDADAPVTLIEFSDLQCPFCLRHHQETFPQIVKEFVDTGKLRYVMREFPLTSIHPDARAASQAALCAGQQDKYWEVRDRILTNRDKLGAEDLASYATDAGLDMIKWSRCMETDLYDEKVEADLADGADLGIQGTPAFALGRTDPADPDRILATKLIEGAYPFEAFEEAINELLGSAD